MRANRLRGNMLRASSWGTCISTLILTAVLSACGGGQSAGETPSGAAVKVVGADGAAVTIRQTAQAPRVTVRAARDGTGAPLLPPGYASAGAIYQFTPLEWVGGDMEVRVPHAMAGDVDTAALRLLVARPGGEWIAVSDARVDGSHMTARVPYLAYATVAVAPQPGDGGFARGLNARRSSTGASSSYAQMQISVRPQGGTQNIASASDGKIHIASDIITDVVVGYSVPTSCTAPTLRVAAGLTPDSTQDPDNGRLVTIAVRRLSQPSGQEVVSLPLSASDRGEWSLFVVAECAGYGAAGYPTMTVGPSLLVEIPTSGRPLITTPVLDLSAMEGVETALEVTASGQGLSFEWQRSTDGGKTYAAVPASNASSLRLTPALEDDGTFHRVKVSNALGWSYSTPAVLHVDKAVTAPVITSSPANQSVIEGQTASFTVGYDSAEGASVRWQGRPAALEDEDAGWSDIAGATSATYTVGPVSSSQNGSQYRAIVMNSAFGVVTSPATLQVSARPVAPAIVRPPVTKNAEQGTHASFDVGASGTSPLNYQWFKNGTPILGANSSSVLIYADPAEVGTRSAITVEVSNAAGKLTTDAAYLVVTAPSTTLIDASTGGVVSGSDGGSIDIPANALPSSRSIGLRRVPSGTVAVPSTVAGVVGDAYQILPDEARFNLPVTLTMPHPGEIPAGYELAIVEFEPGTAGIGSAGMSRRSSVRSGGTARRLVVSGDGLAKISASASSGRARVLCAGQALGSESVTFLTKLGGPKVPALVPAGSCTEYLPLAPDGGAPIGTFEGCGSDASKYADASSTGSKEDVTLKNRHVYCERHRDNFGVALFDRNDLSKSKGLGDAVVEVLATIYGPSNKLEKTFEFRFRVVSYTPASSDPASANPNVTMGVKIDCNFFAADGMCTSNPGTVTLAMRPSSSWSAPITVPVSVTLLTPAGKLPFAHAAPYVRYVYSSSGSPYAERYQLETASTLHIPNMRCDADLAQLRSSGCAFSQAAPVYVLSRTDPSVREAAEHIHEAQSRGSPGRWVRKPGSLAIADSSSTFSKALQRLKNVETAELNRRASCRNSDALINVRPRYASSTCGVGVPGCQCDEYPFAATWNGGYFDPDRTSAKYINAAQNGAAGGTNFSQKFYRRERVVDLSVYESGSVPSWGGGDDFWVHIK